MGRVVLWVGLVLVVAAALAKAAPARRVIHVAAGAKAGGDGSARRPLPSLEAAREVVRAARARGEGAEVVIRGGTYALREPLTLDARDGGAPGAPVIWRAAPGETVRVIGGRMVTGLRPVTDPDVQKRLDPAARGKVLTVDLRAQGLTDYGDPQGGFGSEGDTGMELFLDDVPMTLSRYPNEGFLRIAEVLGPTPVDVRGTKGSKEGIFRIEDPRMARWTGEKDPRALGYWFWDWADQRQKIAAVDPATGTITLREPWHGSGYRKGQYFYAFNLLSEIDRPGEWYLDRDAGRLYVWPPANQAPRPAAPATARRVMVSLLPAIVQIAGARHITFRNLVFEGARGNAVEISEGEACLLIGCTLRNCGKWAVQVRGGRACGVRGCDVTATGAGGVALEGGARATLTPAGHVVENSHIHHYSRWTRTYQPGIRLVGVGCRALRNLIHDAPHQAIAISGNEHLVEGNEIHSVCEETNDAGALYGWHDWAARGHVIRHNWFHHIYGHEARGANGVYLDDNFSSARIENNVFQSVERAIHLGGGRDHRVLGNLFVDCPRALHIDARGLGWRAYGLDELKKTLEAHPYRQPPWSTRYPELLTLLQNEPMAPVGIVVARNVVVGENWDDIEGKARPYVTMADNLLGADANVLDAGVLLRGPGIPRLRLAVAQKQGLASIPYGRIGLYASPDRARWPVRHPVTRREWASPAERSADLSPHPAAPVHIPRARLAPRVDGRVTESEYASAATVRLAETPGREKLQTPAATARLAHNGRRLYVAITVPLAQPAKLLKEGDWGAADGVEVALRLHGNKPGPIYILHGFPDGRLLASLDGGASRARAEALRSASAFAAAVGADAWTGEFRIDLPAAGVAAKAGTTLGFNLGARRSETDDWMAWTGTGSANWQLAGAGRIVLE